MCWLTISSRLNCEATWKSAPSFCGSACSSATSATISLTESGPGRPVVDARSSAKDGVARLPYVNVRPFASEVNTSPSTTSCARTSSPVVSLKPTRWWNQLCPDAKSVSSACGSRRVDRSEPGSCRSNLPELVSPAMSMLGVGALRGADSRPGPLAGGRERAETSMRRQAAERMITGGAAAPVRAKGAHR